MTCGNSKTPSIEDCRSPIAHFADCRFPVEIRDCLECDRDSIRKPQSQSAIVNLKRQSGNLNRRSSIGVTRQIEQSAKSHSIFGNGRFA
jgi:hypothetical protein